MPWGPLADLVLLALFLFILFVTFGALPVWRLLLIAWLYLPALSWDAWVELSHGAYPLTPLANYLRRLAGEMPYPGNSIGEHRLATVYPQGLPGSVQTSLGGALLGWFNAILYLSLWRARKAHD